MKSVIFILCIILTTFQVNAEASNEGTGGYGYGFSGSFSGSGNPPSGSIPNFDFSNFINGYFDTFKKFNDELINSLQKEAQFISAQNEQGFRTIAEQAGKAGGGGAVASASIGPRGGFHTAAVYPENPNSPNILSRMAGTGQGGQPGTYSSFSSSVSVSDNGKNFHRATSTINDNGKVSTYTVTNP